MLIENIDLSLLTLLATLLRLTTTLPSHSVARLLNGFSLTCNVQPLLAQDFNSILEEGESYSKQVSQYATYIVSYLCSCSVEYV